MKVWKNYIIQKIVKNIQSNSFRRLVFDELCANFLTLSENRKRIKKTKLPKNFSKFIKKN